MVGTAIFQYKILAKLGEGGMGLVYKAEDTRLKRIVALKFLKPDMLGNEQEKARFLREAQAAAKLDHPNICTIFEVNEFDGQTFIAMAFIDGHNLDEKIEAGPLAISEAISIAKQIAEGLQAAHEKGIVHRDIKSANIMVTAKGQVRITDFGLAKLAGYNLKITRNGMTPGTIAYMSPEQARGEDVDDRSDIWSLGVVLYEMITGKLPFKGEHERAMLYSILHDAPEPIQNLKADIPLELQQIIAKALQKRKEDRYQSAEEIASDLQQVQLDISAFTLKKSIRKLKKWPAAKNKRDNIIRSLALGLVFVLAYVIIFAIFYQKREKGKTADVIDSQISFTGRTNLAAISPDGKSIAYVSEVSLKRQNVLVQDIQTGQTIGQAIEAFHDKVIRDIRWSPDGTELLINSANDSFYGSHIVPRLGGLVQKKTRTKYNCWSSDGSKIASISEVPKRIYFLNRTNDDTSSIALKGSFIWVKEIDWSPLGNMLLFLNWSQDGSEIWIIHADGRYQRRVLLDPVTVLCPRWSATGDAIYYLRRQDQLQDLMKLRVSPKNGEARGEAVVVQPRMSTDRFTITKNNKFMLYRQINYCSNLWLITGTQKGFGKDVEPKQLTMGTSLVLYPSISPDGKNIAYSRGTGVKSNIFVIPINDGEERQLTFLNNMNMCPVWSPDGKRLAFVSIDDRGSRIMITNFDGGEARTVSFSQVLLAAHPLIWAPGAKILYKRHGNRNYYFIDPETGQENPLVENESVGWMGQLCYSPDYKKVLVHWNRKPMRGLWLISLEDNSQVLLYSTNELYPIKWSSDKNCIYVCNSEPKFPNILKMFVSTAKIDTLIQIPFEDASFVDITDDGDKIVYVSYELQSDIWLMENFDPEVK